MKNAVLFIFALLLLVVSCSKDMADESVTEVDQLEMPPCSDFNDVDTCQCFNGVWNLRMISFGFSPTPFTEIEEGYNVWFYNNEDSTVVICNDSEYGVASGNYTFMFDDQNDFILLDTLNSVVLTCCGNVPGQAYYFNNNSLTFDWGMGFDGPGYFFERNE